MLDITKKQDAAPFDTARLDQLMEEAGIDVLFATSKHNVQYLLGGHRSFFFDNMDAIGISRYLPVFVYVKGTPQKAGYFGHGMETYQNSNKAVLAVGSKHEKRWLGRRHAKGGRLRAQAFVEAAANWRRACVPAG